MYMYTRGIVSATISTFLRANAEYFRKLYTFRGFFGVRCNKIRDVYLLSVDMEEWAVMFSMKSSREMNVVSVELGNIIVSFLQRRLIVIPVSLFFLQVKKNNDNKKMKI